MTVKMTPISPVSIVWGPIKHCTVATSYWTIGFLLHSQDRECQYWWFNASWVEGMIRLKLCDDPNIWRFWWGKLKFFKESSALRPEITLAYFKNFVFTCLFWRKLFQAFLLCRAGKILLVSMCLQSPRINRRKINYVAASVLKIIYHQALCK